MSNVVGISAWVRGKAERLREIVDSSPVYKVWDIPKEISNGISFTALERIKQEVVLMDIEEVWTTQERVEHEVLSRKYNEEASKENPPAQVVELRLVNKLEVKL